MKCSAVVQGGKGLLREIPKLCGFMIICEDDKDKKKVTESK